ncbi:MAG: hypothetical protein OSJ63_01920 [Bacilli bacterium]|nr:hypothetical protein [Bacilli bacterium]
MSPERWNATISSTRMFYVDFNGNLYGNSGADHKLGVHPVINLKADIQISSGNGSLNSPYIIS